jgi:hypothetical protein
MSSNIASGKAAAGHRDRGSSRRRGHNVGHLPVRPTELRSVAVEAQMELIERLNAENVRDIQEIFALQQRVAERDQRKQQLREENARLEKLCVA